MDWKVVSCIAVDHPSHSRSPSPATSPRSFSPSPVPEPLRGLVIKFLFRDTSIVVFSCHLAAHSHKLVSRNEQCKEVLRETRKLVGAATEPFGTALSQVSFFARE
eukprot:6212789-Pleurochrysis_carterae.AAC.2